MPSPADDLAFIRQLMQESQAAVLDNGKHFILWGSIAAVGLLATWAYAIGLIELGARWVWGGLLVVGWAGSLVIGFHDAGRARIRTTGRRLLSATWIGYGVTLTLVAVAGLFGGAVRPEALSGLMSVIIAGGFLATAVLTGHVWLRWIAAAWWLGGAVMLFRPGIYTLPLLAVMALALQVVPGALLYVRARQRVGTKAA